MADPEQVSIIKAGVPSWNDWRETHFHKRVDLTQADLSAADLVGIDLFDADISNAVLRGANLSKADLRDANLVGVDLRDANLSSADLSGVNLSSANLSCANLTYAILIRAILHDTYLDEAVMVETVFADTVIANVVLSSVKGLETTIHYNRSSIGLDTIYRSAGNIPESFLRGTGVPENFIEYIRSLTGKAIDYYSCFISYSSKDRELAERIHADLQAKDIRVWFAPEDLKIGDRVHASIDEAIRFTDKLMIIISENSINSAWVRREVKRALEKEKDQPGITVLFPIRLDDTVFDCTEQWVDDIRRDRHIGDFTRWTDYRCYQKAFNRLLKDLKMS